MKNTSQDKISKDRQFEGTVINKIYKVSSVVGKGSFGAVHQIQNMNGPDLHPMVVKVSSEAVMMYKEIKALD